MKTSGIAVGLATAYALNVPLVFAKKNKPSTMKASYNAKIFHSLSKRKWCVTVAKEFINEDKILIVDDFLAYGNAILGLKNICEQGGAEVKRYWDCYWKRLSRRWKNFKEKQTGLQVESLAIVESLENGKIRLKGNWI